MRVIETKPKPFKTIYLYNGSVVQGTCKIEMQKGKRKFCYAT